MLNPTMTTLNVRWEPAEGRVKEYRLLYSPAAGGDRNTVGHTPSRVGGGGLALPSLA